VNLVLAILIVVASVAVAITAMLLVRRRAPAGSYFNDGDRAAGVFGVLATGFAVLLGFVVFLAFASYDTARAGAETEAQIVTQQVETAQLLPAEDTDDLIAGLVCYARSVAGVQWKRMESGTLGDDLNPWAIALLTTFKKVDPQTPGQEAAYATWLDQRADREAARSDRIHGAAGVIPLPLWLVLLFTAAMVFGYVLFFADSAERAVVQGVLMGSVVAVIVSTLLLLQFLDNPFHPGVGGLRPVAMERALKIIDQEINNAGLTIQPPCDVAGNAL
jgi:hypothetical protein